MSVCMHVCVCTSEDVCRKIAYFFSYGACQGFLSFFCLFKGINIAKENSLFHPWNPSSKVKINALFLRILCHHSYLTFVSKGGLFDFSRVWNSKDVNCAFVKNKSLSKTVLVKIKFISNYTNYIWWCNSCSDLCIEFQYSNCIID